MIDDEFGAVGEMKIGNADRSTRRKYTRANLSTTNPTWPDLGLNTAPELGNWRLTAWDMARPRLVLLTAENWKRAKMERPRLHDAHTKFNENPLASTEFSRSNIKRMICPSQKKPNKVEYRYRSRLERGRCWVRISSRTTVILVGVFGSFPQSLQTNSRIIPRLGHDRFLPNAFHFTIH
jgi:hypothetical protein